MSQIIGFVLVCAAILTILVTWGSDTIAGLEASTFASLVAGAACLLLIGGWGLREFRGQVSQAMLMALGWASIFVAALAFYTFRYELQDIGARIFGAVVPGAAVTGRDGEVVVTRDADGAFEIDGEANDLKVHFLFDTGASRVVLRYEDARRIGLKVEALEFSQDVLTANGRAKVAPVKLDSVSVGPIRMTDVQASVSQQGALSQSLLGMTFLSRLGSYEVRGSRLILRRR